MTEPGASPSMKTFGAVVKALRRHAMLSKEQFGKAVGLSVHTIAAIEIGRRMPDPGFADRAEDYLGCTGALTEAIRHVQTEGNRADGLRHWSDKLDTAHSICVYDNRMIPMLLQTESYTRALLNATVPPLSDEQIDTAWTAQADHAQLLTTQPNTTFTFIVEEHVLHQLGSPDVAREMADHLLTMSQQRNIALQILPPTTSPHAGVRGPLALLEAKDHRWYAYCDGQETGTLLHDRTHVSTLHRRFAHLQTQALTPHDTHAHLTALRAQL